MNGEPGKRTVMWKKPNSTWTIDSFTDSEGMKYPFEFDVVKGSSSSELNGEELVDSPGDLEKLGIKLVATKMKVTDHYVVKVDTKNDVKRQSVDIKPKVFASVRVSDSDSKLHGGKVSLGMPIPRTQST